ncbi:cytochrome P450 4V2 isoform X2 [Manduca sexta]|uniref:cytochrome P450 4V2 isoform X2 n=1 Tax=Manduca sexta TaxID=7130 RepID=UPI00188F5B2E|nr:cytochrome P450 4V2 isoform X2 [Manduca sexta]
MCLKATQTYIMIVWVLVLGIAAGGYLMLRVYWRRAAQHCSKLPSLPRLPLLGNLHLLSGDGRVLFWLLVKSSKMSEESSQPFVFWIGPCPIIMTIDPDDVRAITSNFIEKTFFYSFGRIWLGDGLVTAPAPVWKHSIKKLGGTFTTSIVEGYQDVFNAQADKLVGRLKACVDKEPFDVMHDLAYTTLEAICQTALGVDRISESIVTEEYYNAFNRCLELFINRGLNIFFYPDFIYQFTPAYKELVKCVTVIHNVSGTIVKKRRQEREEINYGILKENGRRFKAFLDILMELHESDPTFTEQQIRAEVDTIIVGGQETVATTLFYTLLMLGCKKDVQEKLYAEMKEIYGEGKPAVRKEDLPRMQYCEAVLLETLRLFPPIPVVMRYADKDLQLKSCRVVSKTACAINAWGAGRSQRAWGPDAAEFKPERWLTGELPPGYPGSFLAFSSGRRACIGKKYAMAIMKTLLTYCVREFEFVSEAEHMEMKVDIALRAISGHLIQVRAR